MRMNGNNKIEFVYLSQEDVLATGIDMKMVMDIVEKVLSMHDSGTVNLPSKVILDLGERERGRINAMPAYLGGDFEICGIKWIAGFLGNPKKYGLPRANAFIILNDSWTGVPLAIMDGTFISAMRTGAVTGVGARYLARKDSKVAGIIGCGVQAITQLEALLTAISGLNEIRAYDISFESALGYASRMKEKFGVNVIPVRSAEEAVTDADIIVTVTVADEPIVKDAWLKRGSFFSHIGSYQEEEEAVILNADKVVVDEWKEVLHRGTPLVAKMFLSGKIAQSKIYANIGEIINGKKPGRETSEERIFYSPMGMGSEDIAVAARVYQLAREKRIGQVLRLWDRPALSNVM